MRPVRLLLLLSCFIALPVFLTCISLLTGIGKASGAVNTGYDTRPRGVRAFFSFSTPSSLFPPSALISVYNDNSTLFVARPAAFGPGLPSSGLTGQLWVGRGFGDDALLRGDKIHISGWELGCSDVPDWQGKHSKHVETTAEHEKGTTEASNDEIEPEGAESIQGTPLNGDTQVDSASNEVEKDDGTDDHLHRPLIDSNPVQPAEVGEPANADTQLKAQKPIHADIESLQESADIAGKVVMLARGGCGFLEKVKWTQRRGGVALIVGDNQPGAQLTIMYAKGDTSNITIPAVFTSYTSAHILSSLVPPELHDTPVEQPSSGQKDGQDSTEKVGVAVNNDGPTFTSTTASTSSTIVPAKNTQQAVVDSSNGWVQNVLAAVGLNDESPFSQHEDSRRPPSSGNIDWVLLDHWDEPDTQTVSNDGQAQTTGKIKAATKAVANPRSTTSRSADDFVIGVQDWRDPGVIANQVDDRNVDGTNAGKSTEDKDKTINSDRIRAKPTPLKGGSIVPGSGEYGIEAHKPKYSKQHSDPQEPAHDESMLHGLLSAFSHKSESVNSQEEHDESAAMAKQKPNRKGDNLQDKDTEKQQGLWIVLTPTSVSTSPFFDTLLVLVVSPLVTLTIVYALLMLRSRIRRRRWRAPKSVVDRLPVRTYHTMSASSSTTSVQIPTPRATSPASQPAQIPSQDLSRRPPRQRSQTTPGVLTSTDSLPAHSPGEKTQKPDKRKRYAGRQVECVVCLEEYVDGESRVMSLPCGHEFHADCITPWLVNRRRTCPICKGDVVRSLTRVATESQQQSQDDERTADDIQDRAAETVNDEPSAAIPIPTLEEDSDEEEDIERAVQVVSSPDDNPPRNQRAAWRNILNSSVSRLSGDTLWRATPNDRSR